MATILDRPQPEGQREMAAFQRRRVQPSRVDTIVEPTAYWSEDLDMRHLRAIGGLVILLAGGDAALAQEVVNLKGTWLPTQGVHIVDGPSRHRESGTTTTPGAPDTHRTHTSKFVFRFEGQEGRKFWGVFVSGKVSEKFIGAISVDGKRFVMADEDGTFSGTIVNADTLDYCYTHITPTDRAVACGLLVREK